VKDFLITEFGALNDGVSNNGPAIQSAVDAASAVGGGRVIVPSGGTFLSGSFQLKADIEFHLEKGARILASSDYADYLPEHSIDVITNGEVVEEVLPRRAFISAFQAHNLQITGEGEISGNADEFILERGDYIHSMRGPVGGRSQYLERPFTIFIIESHGVSLTQFTLRDPAFWALRTTGCNNLLIDGIHILTDLMVPNADGIDIDRCQNVQILNCELITADDSISLKSCAGTSQYGVVENISISDTYMKSTSGAITLGTEACGDIRNVLVTNCTVEDSHRGFAVRPREGGTVSNILFTNCSVSTRAFSESWWGHGEAIHVTASAWDDPTGTTDGNPERLLEGKVDGVRFVNIDVHSEAAILVWAAHPELVKHVEFDRINITMDSSSKWPARVDLRPNGEIDFMREPHSAMTLMNVDSVSVINSKIFWSELTREKYKSALQIVNVNNFVQHNFEFESPTPGSALILTR
jgi:hypothetical protein